MLIYSAVTALRYEQQVADNKGVGGDVWIGGSMEKKKRPGGSQESPEGGRG